MYDEKNYETVKTFKELAEAIQDHLHSIDTAVDGEQNISPNALTAARIAFVRLRVRGGRDDLPTGIPADLIDLLSLCLDAAQGKSEPKNLMAVNVIPQHFKVTARTIYRWISKERLKAYPDTNGLTRVDAVVVAKYTKRITK